MASSSKNPKDENKKKKENSNATAVKGTKKSIKTPEKIPSTPKSANKSKPKPESKPDKTRTKNKSKSENEHDKNVKPNNKRKLKEEENGEEDGEETKVCVFPMNRIKRIIKGDDSRIAVSQDVVFLVNKATEMFLDKFCEDGYKCAIKDRKKSLSYKHLSTVVHERKRYEFLSDYVPQKIKAEDALKEMNSSEIREG